MIYLFTGSAVQADNWRREQYANGVLTREQMRNVIWVAHDQHLRGRRFNEGDMLVVYGTFWRVRNASDVWAYVYMVWATSGRPALRTVGYAPLPASPMPSHRFGQEYLDSLGNSADAMSLQLSRVSREADEAIEDWKDFLAEVKSKRVTRTA